MARAILKFGFLMDPIDRILPDKDTTFVFMMEAEKRGHEVLYFTPRDMYAAGGTVRANVSPASVRRGVPHYSLGQAQDTDLKSLDAIFFRTDPPVDMEYLYQTFLLDLLAQDVFIINNPTSVRSANEKLFTLNFPDIVPPYIVTQDGNRIRKFIEEAGGKIVVKPLNLAGGNGVFVVETGDLNTNSIIETATEFGRRRIIAQKYVPEVRSGDKRIILLDGKFIGATIRVPSEKEHRANIHVGGICKSYKPTQRDEFIISRIAPALKKMGLYFVGLDVLGDWLTEINVTSPTGIQEINRIENVSLESKVIDFVEKKIAAFKASKLIK